MKEVGDLKNENGVGSPTTDKKKKKKLNQYINNYNSYEMG
jgi:hypothetical protein